MSYFEKKYLFLDNRRGIQFLADYGFENIQLTIIYLDYIKSRIRDVKILEAYYINELNSSLNTQKSVYLPPEPIESVLPFIYLTNRDTAVPIFVYGPDLTKVLYVFNSKTSFYNEFNVHRSTLETYLDKEKKLFNYFSFTISVLDGSDLEDLLSLKELTELKNSVNPKIPSRGQKVKLKDLVLNKESKFNSLSQGSSYIQTILGSCDKGTLRNHMENSTMYKKR